MTFKELENNYKKRQLAWKVHIRWKKTKWQRFWAWVWYLIAFPWVWLFYNIRDWRTFVIFAIVVIVVSIEIWLPLLMAWITWGTDFSKVMLGVAGACELFWLGPGTPFILICTFITIGVKGLFNKIKSRKNKNINAKSVQKSQNRDKKHEN